jgi:hypothetical protein
MNENARGDTFNEYRLFSSFFPDLRALHRTKLLMLFPYFLVEKPNIHLNRVEGGVP